MYLLGHYKGRDLLEKKYKKPIYYAGIDRIDCTSNHSLQQQQQ